MRNLWVAVVMVLGAIALRSLPAWAQMGPAPESRPGMRGGMGATGSPIPQRYEPRGKPEGSQTPTVPRVTATSKGEGMTSGAMEHAAPAPPFYKERTFLASCWSVGPHRLPVSWSTGLLDRARAGVAVRPAS